MSESLRQHAATAEHLPSVATDPGCLVVLSERLRKSPGVVAIEADFNDSTLTVRYRPALVDLDHLNRLADEVAAMFAQRVTFCARREAPGVCEECDLRLGRIPAADDPEFAVTADPGRVGLSRRIVPADTAELKRPLGLSKPWGTPFSGEELEHLARSRWMAGLTVSCLGVLLA